MIWGMFPTLERHSISFGLCCVSDHVEFDGLLSTMIALRRRRAARSPSLGEWVCAPRYEGSLSRGPLLPGELPELVLQFVLEVVEGRGARSYQAVSNNGVITLPKTVTVETYFRLRSQAQLVGAC